LLAALLCGCGSLLRWCVAFLFAALGFSSCAVLSGLLLLRCVSSFLLLLLWVGFACLSSPVLGALLCLGPTVRARWCWTTLCGTHSSLLVLKKRFVELIPEIAYDVILEGGIWIAYNVILVVRRWFYCKHAWNALTHSLLLHDGSGLMQSSMCGLGREGAAACSERGAGEPPLRGWRLRQLAACTAVEQYHHRGIFQASSQIKGVVLPTSCVAMSVVHGLVCPQLMWLPGIQFSSHLSCIHIIKC
jgi:hypothetical protein